MTSNYQNNAGTDLDNIFLANGSGTWTLGFQVAGGQDLGRRYLTSAPLYQTVGYQNSAGTDIGNICGNYQAASMSNRYDNLVTQNNDLGDEIDYTDDDPVDGNAYKKTSTRSVQGYIVCGCTANGTSCNWGLAIRPLNGNSGYSTSGCLAYRDNSSDKVTYFKNYTQRMKWTDLSPNSEGAPLNIYYGGTDAHPGRTFSFYLEASHSAYGWGYGGTDNDYSPPTTCSLGLRVYQIVENKTGRNGWWAKDFWFG